MGGRVRAHRRGVRVKSLALVLVGACSAVLLPAPRAHAYSCEGTDDRGSAAGPGVLPSDAAPWVVAGSDQVAVWQNMADCELVGESESIHVNPKLVPMVSPPEVELQGCLALPRYYPAIARLHPVTPPAPGVYELSCPDQIDLPAERTSSLDRTRARRPRTSS